MQDEVKNGNREVPGLARIPFIGDIFFNVEEINNRKTELVIFLRPVIIGDPNIATDIKDYERYLTNDSTPAP